MSPLEIFEDFISFYNITFSIGDDTHLFKYHFSKDTPIENFDDENKKWYYANTFEEMIYHFWNKSEYKNIVVELEARLYDYFDSLEIPDEPTIYDMLLLSLTSKDVIATFNWDPLLIQAYVRCNKITENLSHILCLHGNVAMGYCIEHHEFGIKNAICPICKKKLEPIKLLYLVKHKKL